MDLGLNGRKAIVCASSRGLGRGCAVALAQAGCELVINGRDEARLQQTAREIAESTGARVTPVAADVSTLEGQNALLAACPAPDILVNNNGGPPRKDFRELDRDAMLAGLVQNMVSPIELIQHVIDGMTERGFGRIVNITSGSVKRPLPGLDLSSGARAGLSAFMAGVSRTVAHRNVTINNLLPGKFDTDRFQSGLEFLMKKTGCSAEEGRRKLAEDIPAQRFGDPEEFGRACAFLCSAYSGYITNQNLLIDGGLYEGTF